MPKAKVLASDKPVESWKDAAALARQAAEAHSTQAAAMFKLAEFFERAPPGGGGGGAASGNKRKVKRVLEEGQPKNPKYASV